ncbi:hypothetical protein Sango_2755800 [Sesamum angolense]|uniref:HAT C-terminal dimerisation domain-containing protein n=1 Tax=Sesamum angolense TaxID=2727404 RepID=A0AAE1T8W3_9LAMI|nr:hypothetical protein Sango_2755800 [Sesamum angolense]
MSKVASMGHGYAGPSYHGLRVSLLKDAKKQVALIVDSFRNCARLASKVTCYIYNNKWPLNWLRQREWTEILRPGDTRFATTFIALKSLSDHKDDLQAMVTCQDFKKFLKKDMAKQVKQVVLDERFWNSYNIIVRVGTPLVRLLRIFYSDGKPSFGYVYEGMYRARKAIKALFRNKKRLYQQYVDIINARWDKMLRKSLHAAAYYLNPAFQYDKESFCEKTKVLSGLLDYIDTRVETGGNKAYNEISLYRDRQKSFARPTAMTIARSTRLKLAIRILSQTASSSGCERNWSVFERIHTKKRNRLEHQRLNDLVYVHYNLCLQNRVKYSKRPYDPVDYECIDKSEFWIVEETPEGELDYDEMEELLEEMPRYDEESSFDPEFTNINGKQLQDIHLQDLIGMTRSTEKSMTSEYGWEITCNFYRTETIAKPRTMLAITFSDGTTQLDVVIFVDLAENLLGITALELMKNEEEESVATSDKDREMADRRTIPVWHSMALKFMPFSLIL